jgi:hypothetical protein
MNRKENLKTAVDRLKEAQQLLLLAIEKDAISSIERDIILEKLRKAYDSILFDHEVDKIIVSAAPQVPPARVKVEKVPEIPLKPNTPEVKPQGKTEPNPPHQSQPSSEGAKKFERTSIFEPVKKIKQEPIADDSLAEKGSEKIVESKINKEESISDSSKSESLAEKFQGKRKFMTDSLSNQIKTKPVASKLQGKAIEDLTKEIGVHDRFMFIKELFNGDIKSYEETIQKVNQFDDIAEALIYIQENFNWNENNKAANKFTELVRRKLLND